MRRPGDAGKDCQGAAYEDRRLSASGQGRMVSYQIVFTRAAAADVKKVKSSHLAEKVQSLLALLEKNPFQNPPPYEKLQGSLKGSYSRRINLKHRLVYEVLEEEKTVKVLSLWTHYAFSR